MEAVEQESDPVGFFFYEGDLGHGKEEAGAWGSTQTNQAMVRSQAREQETLAPGQFRSGVHGTRGCGSEGERDGRQSIQCGRYSTSAELVTAMLKTASLLPPSAHSSSIPCFISQRTLESLHGPALEDLKA